MHQPPLQPPSQGGYNIGPPQFQPIHPPQSHNDNTAAAASAQNYDPSQQQQQHNYFQNVNGSATQATLPPQQLPNKLIQPPPQPQFMQPPPQLNGSGGGGGGGPILQQQSLIPPPQASNNLHQQFSNLSINQQQPPTIQPPPQFNPLLNNNTQSQQQHSTNQQTPTPPLSQQQQQQRNISPLPPPPPSIQQSQPSTFAPTQPPPSMIPGPSGAHVQPQLPPNMNPQPFPYTTSTMPSRYPQPSGGGGPGGFSQPSSFTQPPPLSGGMSQPPLPGGMTQPSFSGGLPRPMAPPPGPGGAYNPYPQPPQVGGPPTGPTMTPGLSYGPPSQPMGGFNNASGGGYMPQQPMQPPPTGPNMGQPTFGQPPMAGGAYPPQHPQQFQQQPQPQQQQQQRIDPDAIPNPIDVMQANVSKGGIFRTNEPGVVPPLVTTEFTCKDEGICNPRFIRSTLYSVPNNQELLKQSRLPIALSITPFARLAKEEYEPPITNLGELGPVRCKRCKAYMSPAMQFIDAGRRFTCPYCEDVTSVPQEYFNHLDHMGKRVDMYERPELCLGSYEFVATKDYCRNQQLPQPPAFIFIIDVSVTSVRYGMLDYLCKHFKQEILANLPKEGGPDDPSQVRVGFITYDKELHFYNLKSTLAQPQMMIVSDVEEMFVPILDGFLVKPSESEAVIDSLLAQLPEMFSKTQETELALGPVIEAGIEALQQAKCSGKLFIFHTNLPTAHGPGQLKNREDKKLLGTDKEKQILLPQNDYYTQLGKKCVESGCSIDLFLMPNQYVDLATISEVTNRCSGQIYKYEYFSADSHGDRLIADLKNSVQSTVAFDAVMKVRTSTGIKPNDYLGHFNIPNVNDVEFAGLDRDHTICVELKHEDKLNEQSKVFIQMALLYTSVSGQRRIRIHNLSLNVCSQYNSLYPSCELDTIINYMAKITCRTLLQSTPKQVYELAVQQVANTLACYRKNCANAPSRGQFILPETLKLMPLFVNSIFKSDAISGSKTVNIDERSFQMYRLMSMDVNSTFAYFYPRLLSLHDLESTSVPRQLRCSYERLRDDGIYLLENGLFMYIWIGANVSQTNIQNLFGSNQQQINIEKSKLIEIDTPLSINVRSVIDKVNQQRNTLLKLIVVRQKDNLEAIFRNYLIEDKSVIAQSTDNKSYVEFLYLLHGEIRNLLN